MCMFCSYGSNWKVKEGKYEAFRLQEVRGEIIEGCKYLNCHHCSHKDAPKRFESMMREHNCFKSDCPIKV